MDHTLVGESHQGITSLPAFGLTALVPYKQSRNSNSTRGYLSEQVIVQTAKAQAKSMDALAALRQSTEGLTSEQQDTALKRLLGQSWQVTLVLTHSCCAILMVLQCKTLHILACCAIDAASHSARDTVDSDVLHGLGDALYALLYSTRL